VFSKSAANAFVLRAAMAAVGRSVRTYSLQPIAYSLFRDKCGQMWTNTDKYGRVVTVEKGENLGISRS
jgi:hypothetical protein